MDNSNSSNLCKMNRWIPVALGFGGGVKLRMHKDLKIVSPEEDIFFRGIEACPTSYRIQYMFPSILPLIFLW